PLVYGERWLPAAQALGGLAFFGAMRVVFDLMATYLTSVGATRAVLLVQAIWLAALGPAMVIGISGWGLAGAGWAHVVVGAFVALPAYSLAVRSCGVAVGGLLRGLAVPALAVLPAVLAGMGAASLVDNRLLALLLGGPVATLVYAGLTGYWLRRQLR